MSSMPISLGIQHLQKLILSGTAAGVGHNLSSADPAAGLRAQTAVLARPLLTLRPVLVEATEETPSVPSPSPEGGQKPDS